MNVYSARVGDKVARYAAPDVRFTVDWIEPAGSAGRRFGDGPGVHARLDGGQGYALTIRHGSFDDPSGWFTVATS